jgi:hypothetical protein
MKQTILRILALLSLMIVGAGTGTATAQTTVACDGTPGVYLYEHSEYRGRCVRFTESRSELSGLEFNNISSSLRIVGSWTATLYVDQDFEGSSSTFVADDPDFRGNIVGTDRASSIRVKEGTNDPLPPENKCNGATGVYLYEDRNFRGNCVRVTRDTADLSDLLFNNTASSIRIQGDWNAILFADQYYEGTSTTFTDEDPDLSDNLVGENAVTSLRIQSGPPLPELNRCDGRDGIYLYENEDYSGRCLKTTEAINDLRAFNFDDTISSVGIVGNYAVTLYRDLDLSGEQSTFTQGAMTLSDDTIGDNQATSLSVVPGGVPPAAFRCNGNEGLYLYEHPNYLGRCIRFTEAALDLRDFAFDDTASSFRIVGGGTVTLFQDLAGYGTASTFTSNDPNLADDAVGDNQTTSLQFLR